jgi:hypothetical protein
MYFYYLAFNAINIFFEIWSTRLGYEQSSESILNSQAVPSLRIILRLDTVDGTSGLNKVFLAQVTVALFKKIMTGRFESQTSYCDKTVKRSLRAKTTTMIDSNNFSYSIT